MELEFVKNVTKSFEIRKKLHGSCGFCLIWIQGAHKPQFLEWSVPVEGAFEIQLLCQHLFSLVESLKSLIATLISDDSSERSLSLTSLLLKFQRFCSRRRPWAFLSLQTPSPPSMRRKSEESWGNVFITRRDEEGHLFFPSEGLSRNLLSPVNPPFTQSSSLISRDSGPILMLLKLKGRQAKRGIWGGASRGANERLSAPFTHPFMSNRERQVEMEPVSVGAEDLGWWDVGKFKLTCLIALGSLIGSTFYETSGVMKGSRWSWIKRGN